MKNAKILRCAKVLRHVKRKTGGVLSVLLTLVMLCTILPKNMVFARTAAESEELSSIPLVAEPHRSTKTPDIYVSPNGNDQTGDGSAQKPFKSLARAKEAVRSLPKTGDIVVEFADGFYEMTETVEFGVEDSGNENCTIYYQAAPGATPILSGGKKITGTWEIADDVTWLTGGLKAYKTTLERNGKLRAIYVNGERANMTEKTNVRPINDTTNIPRYSFYASGEPQYKPEEFYVAGQHCTNETAHIIRNQPWIWQDCLNVIGGTKFSTADLPPDTRNPQNIELSAKVGAKWVWPLACVAKTEVDPADPSRTIAHLQMPYNALAQNMDWGTAYSRTNTHVIYNVFEHLEKPGDFYFDEANKTLYYIPRAGESMESAEVIIPELVHLIDIGGNVEHGSYVTNITFSGLTFSHADWKLYKMGDSYGYSTVQTCTMFTAIANGNWHLDMYRSYDVVPSAITVNKAKNIRFLDGGISFTGANGLHLENDVWDCEVTGNFINRVGHAGVVVGHPQHLFENDPENYVVSGSPRAGTDREKFPRGTESVPRNIYVTNNYFYRTGYLFKNNNNFAAFFVQNLQVLHNFFFDVPCSAIMVGWGWWEFDGTSRSRLPGIPTNTSFNNKVSYNRIENYCMNVDDAGGIYTLGTQGKNDWTDYSEMNYNFINGWREGQHTGWVNGFHPDEGSKFINFTGNVVQRISRSVYEFNDFNGKSDMNVYQGFADIPNLFGTEAPRTTLDLTVIPDRTWPQMGHDVVLNSGLTDEYVWMVPESILSKADYELASNVQYRPGMKHHRRGLLSPTDEVWIAPRNTTTFVEGDTMTKSAGNDKVMDIPSKEGTYTLYIRRANETVEVSQFDIVISGRPISEPVNVKDGEEYKVSAVKPLVLEIDDEYYENIRLNGKTINNGHVIGTEGTWVLSIRNKETKDTFIYSFTTVVTDANKLLTEDIYVAPGAEIQLNDIGLTNDVDLWIAGSGDSSLPDSHKGDPRRSWAPGSSTTIKAPNTPGVYVLHVAKNETSDSASDARIKVINGVREIVDQINADDINLWTNAAWDNATELEVNQVVENKKVGREPATGKAKLLWGDDKLYVRVDVTDNDINYSNSASYRQDSVEVYLSEMNFKGSYNGTQGNQYRVTVPGGRGYEAKTSHTGVTYNSMQTETGYSIFLSIPSRSGGFSDGQVIGFDVQINDATTPENDRTAQTTWSDPAANGYNSSAEWGELILLGVRPKLTDLSISTGKLKPDFDPNIKEYTVYVDETTSEVEITAAGKAGTTVEGDGLHSLTGTLTELSVIVTDTASGITSTYIIKVTKVPSVVPDVPQDGLDLWLMADKGVTTGTDGEVTSWVNQVTTGATANAAFTPTAANFRPKLMTDSDKGYKYVYFDGEAITGPVSLKSTGFKDYNGQTELTVITVALPESNPNPNGDQASAVWMGESAGWGGTYFSPGATEVKMRLGSGATAPGSGGPMTSSFTRTATPTELVMDAFVFNNGTHTLYENGEQKTIAADKLTPMARNLTDLNIGGTSSSYNPVHFKGRLAEVLVYDRALTQEEITSIQEFMADKYSEKAPVGSDDATLQSLSVSPGTLTPNFSSDVFNYTVEVGPDVDSITVSATAKDANATVIGDGVSYPLNMGQNFLYVVVTSENGEVELTYKIVVIRTTEEEEPGEAPVISLDQEDSTVTEAIFTVSGTVTDADGDLETVTVNGEEVEVVEGAFSIEITLSEGENIITVVATDSEGNTTEKTIKVTYQIPGKPFIITPVGGLVFEGGIKATASISLNPEAETHSGTEVVVFQLMNGDTPVGIIALEKDITETEQMTAFFNVDPEAGDYTVEVYVFDIFDNSNQSAPIILADRIIIQ